mmetsp:Transcript_6446/g.10851  ORF Transcript_6446/g.10851 Transcript_6446/m.10851 type:complete len:221 (+) Transcript_6446:1445-2107(+)
MVYYSPRAPCNLLSFSNLRRNRKCSWIDYDWGEDQFEVQMEHGRSFKFQERRGLYICDCTDRVFNNSSSWSSGKPSSARGKIGVRGAVKNPKRGGRKSETTLTAGIETVRDNLKSYTKQQVRDAQRAHRLMHALGMCSPTQLAQLIRDGRIPDTTATVHRCREFRYESVESVGASRNHKTPAAKIEYVPLSSGREQALYVDLMVSSTCKRSSSRYSSHLI